jgi:hypothetical protein
MKRLLCLLFVLTATLSLCACQGNFGSVSLKDPVNIPENGVVDKSTVTQIKNENAIAVFVGKSGDFKYEWTIFGRDIADSKEINLGVQLTKTQEGDISVTLNQSEPFGFSATLAVYLNEQWNAQSATAYAEEKVFATVSVTGGKNTILNLNLDGTVDDFVIKPDSLPQEQTPTESTAPSELENTANSATTPAQPEEETGPIVKPTEPAKPTEPTQPVTEPTKPTETQGKDKYNTDPIPEGKPKPVEPENQDVDKRKAYSCTFSIECSTILNNLDQLDPDKLEMVPSGGVIFAKTTVTFYEGESVFDVLQRVCKEKGIHLESSWTPM